MARTGRPPIDPEQRRSKMFTVGVTATTHELMTRARGDMAQSEWVDLAIREKIARDLGPAAPATKPAARKKAAKKKK